jgi:hypothetical protein
MLERRVIFSENRFPLFGITRYSNLTATNSARSAATAEFAQVAQTSPLRGFAEFPRQPQNETCKRQNRYLSDHQKQKNHPRRLMHDAPVVALGRHQNMKTSRAL